MSKKFFDLFYFSTISAGQGERDKLPRAEAEPLVVVLERQVEDLKAQVADRGKQIGAFNQLFVTYRYNAQQLGITPEQLEKPIPARGQIERGRS
ncbi:hypothetical protein ACH0BU_14355 [Sphingomonas olei]